MNKESRKLIRTIYSPPLSESGFNLNVYLANGGGIKFFPFARNALFEILQRLNCKSGDVALVPSFICRDVLSPFNTLGMNIKFYDVNPNLTPVKFKVPERGFKVILGVHYFGFENDFDFLNQICEQTGATLIIDNAHGFLSKNKDGILLGTEKDWGIVSVRKSLPIVNGAILFNRSDSKLDLSLIGHIKFPINLKFKNLLRKCSDFVSLALLNKLVDFKRIIRRLMLGQSTPISSETDELLLPSVERSYDFRKYISKMDVEQECQRRRDLFFLLIELLKNQPVTFIRDELGPYEVPYVFPFVCNSDNIDQVSSYLLSHDLEIIKWPALPGSIALEDKNSFYDQVYLVKFLW